MAAMDPITQCPLINIGDVFTVRRKIKPANGPDYTQINKAVITEIGLDKSITLTLSKYSEGGIDIPIGTINIKGNNFKNATISIPDGYGGPPFVLEPDIMRHRGGRRATRSVRRRVRRTHRHSRLRTRK